MDIFEYIDRVKANFDKKPEPRYNMKKYFMGGLATPKRGLVDEPGSYAGELPKSLSDLTEVFGNRIRLKSIGENAGKIALTTSDATAGYGTKYYDNNEAGIKKLRKIAENAIARNNPRTSEKALKNIKEFEERTGLKHKDFSVSSQIKIEKGKKNVGKNILLKQFEESKEGQKIIKDFEEKTGKKYEDQVDSTRRKILKKTYTFKANIPFDDPTRFKEIKDFINNTKKTFGYLPTRAEINNHFVETKGTRYENQIDYYVNKTKIKLPKGQGAGAVINLENRIKKLLKNKTITNILDEGRFPTNSVIKNILKVDPTTAGDTAFDLAKTLSGEREIRFFKAPTKYKKIAQKYVTENVGNVYDPKRRFRKERGYYERGFSKLLNLPKNIGSIRQDIINKLKKIIPEMKNLSVDEIGSITSSMRTGSGPYAIFGQVIDKDFNTAKGSLIDAKKGILENKLINLAKNNPERLRLQKNYNERVDQFEFNANKNNPIKKVKGLKLSFKPPSKTVKNKKVYNQYKDLFDAHYEKYGYSFEVPADRDSIVDISKKLDNKAFQNTVKNRFKTLIGKGGKFGALVGAGTLAGTGFALADQPNVQEAAESFPTKTAAGAGLAAATVGTKTGRNILGKTFKGLDKGVLRPLTALEAPSLAVPQSAYYVGDLIGDVKRGEQTDVKGMDITLPTSLSYAAASKNIGLDLFADNAGKIKKALRSVVPFNPTLQNIARLSKGSVFATPIIETAIQIYNAKKRLEDSKKKSSVFEERIPTLLGDAPKSYYDEIMSELPEVDRMGASSGGIASGPPPEKGPQSQGLAYLMKNGKR